MRKYNFEDFRLEKDNGSLIEAGEFGMKLQISIFSPFVPEHYREKALDVLNGFLEKHPDITVTSTDSLAVMLEAYIDEDVDTDKKYRLVFYLWNETSEMEKGYVVSDVILPTDEHFSEFEECVMWELWYMGFGNCIKNKYQTYTKINT